ncbi:hypothetical protein [Hyphomonas sp. CY54-11-8]|uniref:hypothetical protein n=1 Tax=Hyphomonas sp. CY54-11-8 TaxID=1280944 RepID=UPI000458BC1C|nr:hypothetical protein [Hyphomonas sp. CY54-11-8]KCZ47731.1 hypothetical protein HY17_04445 [Hyphomonas sp. CY54-11-8]
MMNTHINDLQEQLARVCAERDRHREALLRLVVAGVRGGYRDSCGMNIKSHPAFDHAYVVLTCDSEGNNVTSLTRLVDDLGDS